MPAVGQKQKGQLGGWTQLARLGLTLLRRASRRAWCQLARTVGSVLSSMSRWNENRASLTKLLVKTEVNFS